MSSPFPPPRPPGDESIGYASVVREHRAAWPKRKWLKVPLWAWIGVGVLGLGAVGAVSDPKKDDQGTVVAADATGAPTVSSATPTSTVSSTTSSTAAPTTAAPTTPAPTVAPTPAPAPPPTAARTPPPTPAPTTPPTPAPTAPPTVPTPPPPIAAPTNNCDPNYTPCVPIDSDVDCAGGKGNGPSYVRGPVYVIGSDIYGLDGNDNDGVGCE